MASKANTLERQTAPIDFDGTPIYLIGPMVAMQKVLTAASKLTARPERMCLLIGPPGLGKTLGARWFAAQHEDAVHVQLPPAPILRPGRLLRIVEAALDMAVGGQATLYDATLAIIEELSRRPRLLLFDDAHRLRRYDYVDMLRFIHDEAGARMAFISIPALEHVFRKYREFDTRVQIYHRLKPPTKPEIAGILEDFSEEAVDAIYELTGGRMREVMVLAEHFRMNDVPARQRSAANITKVARTFMLRAS